LQAPFSYLRSDAQSASYQLADALKLRFGPEQLFFDRSRQPRYRPVTERGPPVETDAER
jgi:hypothetical protein